MQDLPETRAWIQIGIKPRAAMRLCGAGYLTLESVSLLTREELLSIGYVGQETLRRIEGALGRPLYSVVRFWMSQGVVFAVATILAQHKIQTVDQLAAIKREDILRLSGIREDLARQIEQRLGIRFRSDLETWTRKGLSRRTARTLKAAGINTWGQLIGKTFSDLNSMDIRLLDLFTILRLTDRLAGRRSYAASNSPEETLV